MRPFPSVLRAGVAASLLVSASAWAGQPPDKALEPAAAVPKDATQAGAADKAPAAPKRETEVADAIGAAITELQAAFPSRAPMNKMAEELASFRYSPETSARLTRIFGTDQPLLIKKAGKAGDYTVTLQAVDYTSPDKSRLVWQPSRGKLHVDPSGRSATFAASWPSISFTDKDGRLTVEGISVRSNQRRGIEELALGQVDIKVDSVSMAGKSSFTLANISVGGDASARGKLVDMAYRFSIGGMRTDKLDIGSLALGVTLQGIPAHVVARMTEEAERDRKPGELTEGQLKMVQSMFRAVADAGGAVRLDELRYTLNGHSAWLKGEMRLKAAPEGDTVKPEEMFRQLNGRFQLRVPVSLVAELSRSMTRMELAKRATPDKPVTEDQVKQASQLMTDIMIGKMIGQGYATMEKDAIVSLIEIGDGKMLANGKQIELPSAKANGSDAGAADEDEAAEEPDEEESAG